MNSSHSSYSPRIRQMAAVSVVSGALSLLAGCSSEPESHLVSAPPPPAPATTQVVVAQPQTVITGTAQLPNGTIIVTQAPPAVQQELVTAQPSSDHRWIPGYWTWRNERYEWVTGHWALPPNSGSVWIAPRWERTDTGVYRFYEGYWN